MVYIESNFECSKTLPRNAGELTDKTKIRSKNRREISSSANYRSKVRFERSSIANYCANFRAEWNNRCHEILAIYRRNFAVSEISSKSREKPGNSSKLTCITFAQYCMSLALKGWNRSKVCFGWILKKVQVRREPFTANQKMKQCNFLFHIF